MDKALNLISYFGGKYPHLKWLTDKFPKGNYHFVDIMCGSANVALNVNYPLITINDLNEDVVNLFFVLRDHFEEFTRAVYFTPFSRSELYRIIDNYYEKCDPIEKARRYFVRSQLGFGANAGQNNHKGAGFEYKLHNTQYYRVDNWNVKLKRLAKIAEKLRTFQIECRNAMELFDKVNKPDTIIYFDPPYLLSTRSSKKRYMHEVDDEFHIEMAKKISEANCFVAVSGYEHPLYEDLFKSFYRQETGVIKVGVKKKAAKEVLWTNYDPMAINGMLEINFSY